MTNKTTVYLTLHDEICVKRIADGVSELLPEHGIVIATMLATRIWVDFENRRVAQLDGSFELTAHRVAKAARKIRDDMASVGHALADNRNILKKRDI